METKKPSPTDDEEYQERLRRAIQGVHQILALRDCVLVSMQAEKVVRPRSILQVRYRMDNTLQHVQLNVIEREETGVQPG